MTTHSRRFVPAAGHDWLLPLYDPVLKLLGADSARRELVDRAQIGPGQRVLEIGCGTGGLLVLIGKENPGVELVGLDPDPKALARARRKAERAGLRIDLERGFADALPYPPAHFDRVFSSFMLHHLGPEVKRGALAEARRVLRPGGSLHVLDFGGAERRGGPLTRWLHSAEHLRDNYEGRIPALMREAGFPDASQVAHRSTLFGRIAYWRGSVPRSGGVLPDPRQREET